MSSLSLSAKALCNSSYSPLLFPRSHKKPHNFFKIFNSTSSSTSTSEPLSTQSHQSFSTQQCNYAGVKLQETVDKVLGKTRFDYWISNQIEGVSRARVQSRIRSGLVSVNGRVIDKVSHVIRAGDQVNCTIADLLPLRAELEDLPLDIVYEDAHILVVNKPAHMRQAYPYAMILFALVLCTDWIKEPVDCLLLQRTNILMPVYLNSSSSAQPKECMLVLLLEFPPPCRGALRFQ